MSKKIREQFQNKMNIGVYDPYGKLTNAYVAWLEQRLESGQVDAIVNRQANWELCPNCEGTTRIIVDEYSADIMMSDCQICNAKGIINSTTGKPPTD